MTKGKMREFALIVILAYCVAWGIKGIAFTTTPKHNRAVTVGEPFPLENARLSGARSLVLVTSDKCPYSRASEPFHRRLIDTAHRLHIPLLVVTDTKSSISTGISNYLDDHDQLTKTNLPALHLSGTPTVLLIESGKVKGSWAGKMNEEQENGLLARLDGSFHTLTLAGDHPQVLQLKPDELASKLNQSHVLDIRSRDQFRLSHLDGTTNIPYDELGARMQIELHEDGRPFVIDCRATDMGICLGNAKLLEWGGLKQVWLLDAGAVGSACSMSPI